MTDIVSTLRVIAHHGIRRGRSCGVVAMGMRALYNEIDRFCCDWLQNLMDAGHITPGKIDDRSIVELTAVDVAGYDRVHFFAGLAGWDFAANLAGWDGPLWTGSCPCQPFSAAGKQRGSEDERHLWPAFFRLIRECRPPIVVGEQVSGAAGMSWLDHVLADLEGEGYAAAAADLPACSVGTPHRRQRIWWVAMDDARISNVSRPEQQRRRLCGQQTKAQPIYGVPSIFEGICNDTTEIPHWPSDGLYRPVGPMRAYGNAIVPQVAAEFLAAVMECRRS